MKGLEGPSSPGGPPDLPPTSPFRLRARRGNAVFRAGLQELATVATQAATDAGLAAAKVEHAVQHMRGIRPDIVFTDDSAGGKRDVVEVKTISFCPSWYGVRFANNGDTWVEARAREAVKSGTPPQLSSMLPSSQTPDPRRSPPLRSRASVGSRRRLSGPSASTAQRSTRWRSSGQHGAPRPQPTTWDSPSHWQWRTSDTASDSAWRAAGAWRDFSKSIRARLPFVHTSAMDAVVQVDLSRCDERTEREYRNHADSFARGNHGAGGRDRNQRGLSAPATQHHDPPS